MSAQINKFIINFNSYLGMTHDVRASTCNWWIPIISYMLRFYKRLIKKLKAMSKRVW